MSLRDDAIAHMAKALYVRRNGGNWRMYRPKAESALDALLDFLGAHTEEWADGEGKPYCMTPGHVGNGCDCPSDDQVRWLVAALRGTTEEENQT